MPRIRCWYSGQSDERPAPPPPFQVEEQSDYWWSGVRLNAVAVPIAGTLAAVALSASLAWGVQQQTEDIVPPPPTIAEEAHWQVCTPPRVPVFLRLPSALEEDLVTAAPPPFGGEEDLWFALALSRDRYLAWLPPTDEEIVPQPVGLNVDEDSWLLLHSRIVGSTPVVWAVDDEFPGTPPALLEVQEDYWWTQFSLPSMCWTSMWVVDDEIVPQPPPAPAVEEMILFRVGPIWIRID